jgi:hypothetical protein
MKSPVGYAASICAVVWPATDPDLRNELAASPGGRTLEPSLATTPPKAEISHWCYSAESPIAGRSRSPITPEVYPHRDSGNRHSPIRCNVRPLPESAHDALMRMQVALRSPHE